jgi:UrcA family protein
MNNVITFKQLLTPILLVALSSPALTSAAVQRNGIRTDAMKITVSDLDLSQREGVETLYSRLKKGANNVCGVKHVQVTGSRIASSKIKQQHRKCYAKALNNAVKNINNKMLTDLHTSNT